MASRSIGSLVINLIAQTLGFEQGMSKAARSAEKTSKKISSSLKAIGTAGAAAAAAAGAVVVAWTRDVIDLGNELEKFSKISKSSTQEFQRWAAGAASVGISQEKLSDQLKDFNEKLGEFRETGGGGMKDFFEQIAPKIGLTAEAFRDLSGPQALQLYYDSLQKANLSQEQLSFYLESMASDTTALIPLLKDGGKGFKDFGDMAERAGAIIDTQTMEAIRGLRKQTAELDQVMLGLKIQMAQGVVPAIEDFAELLNSDSFRSGFQAIIEGSSKSVAWLAKLATETASVTKFLGEEIASRINGPALDDIARSSEELARIEKRIAALRQGGFGAFFSNADPAFIRDAQSRKGIWETTFFAGGKEEELAFLETYRSKLREGIETFQQMQLAASRAVVNPEIPLPVTSPPTVNPPKAGGTRKPSAGSDEALEELRRVLEAQSQWHERMLDLQADLAGPIAQTEREYAKRLSELEVAFGKGETTLADYATTQELLTQARDADIKALREQLTPAQQFIEDLRAENELLAATRDEQLRLTAARYAGADATAAQIEEAYEWLKVNEQMREANANWEEFGRGLADTFQDLISGAATAGDAIKSFLDDLNSQILRNITQDWADQLTDWFKTFAGGASSSGGGNWIGSFLGAFGFSGGRAAGGWVGAGHYAEVNERGIEMATVRGRQYLLAGDSPVEITPNHRLGTGGRGDMTVNFVGYGRPDRRTAQQAAADVAVAAQRSLSRNGRGGRG